MHRINAAVDVTHVRSIERYVFVDALNILFDAIIKFARNKATNDETHIRCIDFTKQFCVFTNEFTHMALLSRTVETKSLRMRQLQI